MKKLTIAAAFAAFLAMPAAAQQCGPYEQVRDVLSKKYGEQMTFMGEMSDGRFVMVWGNPAGSSWTIIISDGNAACLVSSGSGFQVFGIGNPA